MLAPPQASHLILSPLAYTLSIHTVGDDKPIISARRRPNPEKAFSGSSRNSRRHRCNTLAFTSQARATSASLNPISNGRTAATLTPS